MRRVVSLALALAGTAACRAEPLPVGQLVLHVDTNAFVPLAPDAAQGARNPRVPPESPLVDRVRFDVLRGGQPISEASREFPIDESLFKNDRVSIGVVPPDGAGDLTVRIRLYRADRVRTLEPPTGVTLDTTVQLPPLAAEGKSDVTVFLDAEDFGRPLGRQTPLGLVAGLPGKTRVGTWARGRRTACAAASALGSAESCIAGGSFFLGEPAFAGRTRTNDITAERLVVISPFFVDLTEVTVAAFRSAWPSLSAAGVDPPLAFSGNRGGASKADWCTWSETPALGPQSLERLPLNCVSWSTARAYCQSLGKDLPSEAQYEFLMSGQGMESGYPWGSEDPDCNAAIWGRAGAGVLSGEPSDCSNTSSSDIGGVEVAGSGVRDRLIGSDGAVIVDLVGNLSEWTRDQWSEPSEAFWSPTLPMTDPVGSLLSPSDGDRRPLRGGSWLTPSVSARAGFRLQNLPTDHPLGAGFRCARRGN
jgi:formylglycine-generating enzyme required for sulfatase activity